MLSQNVKNIYFEAAQWLTLPNYYAKRGSFRNQGSAGGLYLHLGSGIDYREGFINIEANVLRKKDAWLDLRNGLPFPSGSARFIYSCHVLEHLYPEEALALLAEINRTLSADGVARIAVPSFEHALQIAVGAATSTFPRQFDDASAQAINHLFCDGQHRYAYSFPLLKQFALHAGFADISNYSAVHGTKPARYGSVQVGDEPAGSLIVELRATPNASETDDSTPRRPTP